MCNRVKRYSGALTLLSVLFAWLLALRDSPPCTSPAVSTLASKVMHLPSPPPPPNSTAAPAPTSAPAVHECAIPLDVLAPTRRPSPSAYPTLRPAPRGALDAEVEAARAAALRRHTTQCGTTFSDLLGNHSARLRFCDDYPRALLDGRREALDGPFYPAGCASVWFTPGEACDLLAGLNRLILFVGDSIARQLNQGFVNVLTGAFTHGGVPKFSFPEAESCRCDDAYKFDCRERTYANYQGPGDLICPKWVGRNYVATQMRLHSVDYFKEHFVEVEGTMTIGEQNYGGSVIVLNLGLHENLDAAFLMEHVYGPTIETAKRRGSVRVICVGQPTPDEALKPAQYRTGQGVAAVTEYNTRLRTFCRDRGVEVMELQAPSQNATSYDGTHYAQAFNVLAGQLLLNLLAQGEWGKATAALGEGFLL
jgi:hypothetical protein